MTTTHPGSLVAGPNATYDLPQISNLMGGSNSELLDLTNRLVERERARV